MIHPGASIYPNVTGPSTGKSLFDHNGLRSHTNSLQKHIPSKVRTDVVLIKPLSDSSVALQNPATN